ncbi:MAG: TetM/TetW/TetO/TetS family tetracycline resistance ribosomal protection protein [Christensenellaceae bacterium]|jgi:ribosomal protection tetracycline resistance protein|nr:TetM/TetW/TetO/TetS family tetracycline resistance ribosomal protection protein [Christensenellaceae bacterium]
MRRNIGIFAHVDAGKTTLTEWLLYLGGVVPKPGSVDEGTAQTDSMEIERRRGISVRQAAAALRYEGAEITLIDTPGHADFAAEVERAIWALDGAIMLFSAVEGVQAQSEIYFDALQKAEIPTIFFINKLDRIGAGRARVLREIEGALGVRTLPLWDGERAAEAACEGDDALLERYLAGETLSGDEIEQAQRGQVLRCELYPVLAGAALRGEGVKALLDAAIRYLPEPAGDEEAPLAGIVYAVSESKAMGRAAHLRLYSGRLENRMPLGDEKVAQIRVLNGLKPQDKGILRAGEIGLVYGLAEVKAGDVLGERALIPRGRLAAEIARPLMAARVSPESPAQLRALRRALDELSAQDPHLAARWSPLTHELYLQLTGGIQIEVLQAVLKEQYGLNCTFSPPQVLYKETIAKEAFGFVSYTMPKPCWAILRFRLSPLPRGAGVRFSVSIDPRKIGYRYLRQVEQSIPRALEQGMLGWEVTDLAIELVDGSDHPIHTHPLDFALATPIGLLDGLRSGGSVLLEPILACRFTVPQSALGQLMGELSALRGSFEAPARRGEIAVLKARLPAAESLDLPQRLAAMTGGRGVMVSRLAGYEPCPVLPSKTAERRGVHPLDTAKYILAARSALESDIW